MHHHLLHHAHHPVHLVLHLLHVHLPISSILTAQTHVLHLLLHHLHLLLHHHHLLLVATAHLTTHRLVSHRLLPHSWLSHAHTHATLHGAVVLLSRVCRVHSQKFLEWIGSALRCTLVCRHRVRLESLRDETLGLACGGLAH